MSRSKKFNIGDRVYVNTTKYDVGGDEPEFGKIGIVESFSGKNIVVNFLNGQFEDHPTVGYYYEKDLAHKPYTKLEKIVK